MTVIARELPPPDTLSERQLRGADRCFCGADLTRSEVTDLGQQRVTVHGARVSWFPRSCPGCPRAGGAS
ncbi:hypothetical protein QR77_08085 [Streptomyces sp. 150FB]|uniref:hypothetical protein n=1 Tax=Streptomyces sp. 150FB TaxID=1576605 RepID=UPI0005893AD1|nr:hypothetical protein [Streptomyces sp. 150FB]KIF73961.1 hypothetical protein QR77_08085 [Streptomyces sp. 150FB]